MKSLLLAFCSLIFCTVAFAQIPESENNGSFATANVIQRYQQVAASVGNADLDDYFMTVLPENGRLEIYVRATNSSASSGYLYNIGYDRRKTSSSYDKYIANNSVIPAGATVNDTIVLTGRAADTFYFRFYSNRFFNYQFSYSILETGPTDAEPNDNFATAVPFNAGETKYGHTNFYANGNTVDFDDYYRTVFPVDGTVKIYVKGINRSGTGAHLDIQGFVRTKASWFNQSVVGSVPHGTTVNDTITLYGMAADTFYFRIDAGGINSSERPFDYELRYEMTDVTPNDAEPNNSFAQATPIAMGETKSGHTNFYSNGNTEDFDDYYRTIFPVDGTLKIYSKATNRSGTSAHFDIAGYDRRKTSPSFDVSPGGTVAHGTTVYDTITLYGRAADTFYFRIDGGGNNSSDRPFTYEFRYEMVDQSPVDTEPNDSFPVAQPFNAGQIVYGHTNYYSNGNTMDYDDYYRTVTPVDGTMKIYVKATNQSGTSAYMNLQGYDRRKVSLFSNTLVGTVNHGTTIYDTIILYSRAADTFYFRLDGNGSSSSERAFNYEMRYEMFDTSANDLEPNNSFAEATTFSGTEVKRGHTGYVSNGTSDAFDYYKTQFATTDSLKLYLQATNYSGVAATLTLTGYNASFAQIYTRTKSSVPHGATVYDSVKILVTAPQTIYNRVGSGSTGFSYQLNLNSRLPGNGFSISGAASACNSVYTYKAINVAALDSGVSYHWSLSSGGSIQFTDSIATITWLTPGTHTVNLYLQNAGGVSVTKQLYALVSDVLPSSAPSVTVKGRYLDIATVPVGAERRWYKDGVYLNVTDSVYYAAAAGNYSARYANSCGEGPASVNLTFNAPQSQTINFPPVSSIGYSKDSFRVLMAVATSGLPVSYKIISGPGILHGDSLFVSAAGTITVQALQFGNADFGAATPVNISVTVVNGPQVITFNAIPAKIYSTSSFALDGAASSGLAVKYTIVSGPATVSGKLVTIKGVGTVQVKASQVGNANYLAAPDVFQSFCIGIRQIDTITGTKLSCFATMRYTTKKITGAIYEWTLGSGGILTTHNDTAIVQWQTNGTHTLTVKAYSACDTVRTSVQSIAVLVDGGYNVGPVTLLAPADNESGLSVPLTLQWQPALNATSYDLYLWPSSLGASPVPLDSNILQVNYDINSNIALNTPYSWKVVAKNVCTSAVSTVRQFSASQVSNGLPDLLLDTLSYQNIIYQGQPLTVTWQVKNNGNNGTGLSTWKDRVYLSPSKSLRVSESTLLGSFDNPSYLLPGETYTLTKTVTVPPGYAGSWYLFVITDNEEAFCFNSACNVFWGPGHYNHNSQTVRESSELNNYRYAEVPILDGPLPDLKVTSAAVPGAIFSGSTFNITYTVKNEGGIPASGKKIGACPQRAWRDRFFVSDQPVFDITTANELPSKEIRFFKTPVACETETLPYKDYLLPDSSYTVQHEVTIPFDFFGQQYFYVYTNGYDDAYEGGFNTNNIRRADSVNITVTPPADLVVTNVPAPSGVQSGDAINIQFTVANNGANAPFESGWYDSVFVCSSPAFSYASVLTKGRANIHKPANFGTGASYSSYARVQVPNGISGTYYVFVRTDARNDVFEFNQELNNQARSNVFTITFTPAVDLVITSISAPDTVTAGVPFGLAYTIKNYGPGTATGWRDYMYASVDSLLNTSGPQLATVIHSGSDSLPSNTQHSYTRQVSVSSTSGLSGKLAFIKVLADGRNDIYEHNAEGNNLAIDRAHPVFIKPAPVIVTDKRSNLKAQSLTVASTVNANTNVGMLYSVKNEGPLNTSKTYWQDRIYLSADSGISSSDVELKRIAVSEYTNTGLRADSQYQRNFSVAIPLKAVGNYYFIFKTDYKGGVENDSTSDDNVIIKPVNIIAAPTPDLVITPLNNIPDTLWGGSSFVLKYSVQNTGPVTAQARWYDRAYVMVSATPNGFPITYKAHNDSLPPGASYIDSLVVNLPTYFNGQYNVIIHADGKNEVYEGVGGDANNIHVRPKMIYSYNSRPASDLIVTSVNVPDSVVLGRDITAEYTIKNTGSVAATGNLANVLYLSSNNVFESNADKLTQSDQLNNISIPPGQSFQAQISGKALPPTAGTYKSIVRTNARNTIHEGSALNNNIGVSDSSTFIDAELLTTGVAKNDILVPNTGNYYKVNVAAGQDLLVTLNTAYAGNGSNAVYVAFNRVPDETSFDATGVNASSLNQMVLLSGTSAGTYYIKAQSFGIAVSEPVSITVATLPFSIISVTPAVVGQGTVSGLLYGGGIQAGAQIFLRKDGSDYHVGIIRQRINSTQLHMEWNTEAIAFGTYDVVAKNPGGAEAVLAGGMTVETTRAYALEYTPLLPAEIRPFGGSFTYKGKNIGNVNIPVLQGDITMVAKNATVHSVRTSGRIRRYTQYIPQADSLMTEDWYLTGKNRVVPFIGREIAPGEEFSITIETRFRGSNVRSEQSNIFPLQCRMIGYSAKDFAEEQVRVFEMMRLLIAADPRANLYPNSEVVQASRTPGGNKYFIEKMINEYVTAGLMYWTDTIGTNFRWDCSRCLRLLPEVKPVNSSLDTFTFKPGGELIVGRDSLGTGAVFGQNQSLLVEMNKGRYWQNYNGGGGSPGRAGEELGWDLLDVHGTLHIDASETNPFRIYLSSLAYSAQAQKNYFSQLAGWNPAYDTSFLIVVASGGITGYDSSKFRIDLTYFSGVNESRGGHFKIELHSGLTADSILLVWRAYRPLPGEDGVDGVDGGPGQPGSPGGPGGNGNAPIQNGGKGGKGGRGSDEIVNLFKAQSGGEGGRGGDGYGSGGNGGEAGESGKTFNGNGCEGAKGGRGGNAGPNGGNGGNGGKGADGGLAGLEGVGGSGGLGGNAGTGNNSGQGGRGGNGGNGGKGGGSCGGGLEGGGGGNGGTGGAGPVGTGADGAHGRKGPGGNAIECPPCSSPLPAGPDVQATAASLIDYGKAGYGAIDAIDQGNIGEGVIGFGTEVLNQATSETYPSVNLAIQGADLWFAAKTAASTATAEWTLMCKGTVVVLKVGDYVAREVFYDGKDYPLSTEVKYLTDFFSTISSVPDLLAFGLKQLANFAGGVSTSLMVKPCDPNEIIGPAGHGDPRFIARTATMPYTIHFENDSLLAEVAAQRVVVRQPISPKADPLTFKLGSFNFGGHTFEVPAGRSNYFTTLHLDSLGYNVEVTAGIDIITREAFWIMQTIDPATGLPPANVFLGFLPVNDEEGRGTGFVNYTIKPLASAITCDSINARASIVFDVNEPVETNTWTNIVDAVAPASSLSGLPLNTGQLALPVSYTGQDDPGGSGLRNFDLYVSTNGAAPVLWLQAYTGTDTVYMAEKGKIYAFYASAVDNVGNREGLTLVGTVTISSDDCIGNDFRFTSNINGSTFQWQVNTGSGFVNIPDGNLYEGVTEKSLYIIHGPASIAGYKYRCLVNGSATSQTFEVHFVSTWEGTENTDWNNPANWNCGVVPNEFTDVAIKGGKVRYPVISSDATVRSVTALGGTSVTVGSGVRLVVVK